MRPATVFYLDMDLLYNGLYGSEKTNVNPIVAIESLGCQLIILELARLIRLTKGKTWQIIHYIRKTAGGKAKK